MMASKKTAPAKADNKFSRYEDRQKAKGLKKMHPWIPVEFEGRFKKFCEKLRKESAKKAEK